MPGCYGSPSGLMKMAHGSECSQLLAWYSSKKGNRQCQWFIHRYWRLIKPSAIRCLERAGEDNVVTRQQVGLPARIITHVENCNITSAPYSYRVNCVMARFNVRQNAACCNLSHYCGTNCRTWAFSAVVGKADEVA